MRQHFEEVWQARYYALNRLAERARAESFPMGKTEQAILEHGLLNDSKEPFGHIRREEAFQSFLENL